VSCERALSIFDVRHRFVSSVLYELPLGKGKRFLNTGGIANQVLGGWQVSNIIFIQPNGLPLTATDDRNISSIGGYFDRPSATGQTVALSPRQPQRI